MGTPRLEKFRKFLKLVYGLARHCGQQLNQDKASQMAAALAYRTIFGLIPMAVLSLIVFKGFVGMDEVQGQIQSKIYEQMGIQALALPGQAEDAVKTQVDEVIGGLINRISGVDFKGIGAIGLVLLIWAAISLVATVEEFFNQLYRAESGRGWHLRIPIYWAVITLGPVLLFASLYLTSQIMGQFSTISVLGPLVQFLSRFTALLSSSLLLFLLYLLLPNTRVEARAAAVGGLFAGILWEIGKWGFQIYVSKAVSTSVLYGSLGMIPIFLMWVYITWWIVLFGLTVTYTIQFYDIHIQSDLSKKFQHDQEKETRCTYDPTWAIPVLARVASRFNEGKSVTPADLARDLQMPENAVTLILERAEKNGFLHQLETKGEDLHRYALARNPDLIKLHDILGLENQFVDKSIPETAILEELRKAQNKAIQGLTLSEALRSKT